MNTDKDKVKARDLIGNVNNYAEDNGELSISAFGPLSQRIAAALAAERAGLLSTDGPLADRISHLVYEHSTIEGDVLVVEDGQALRQAIELLVVGERAEAWREAIVVAQASTKKSIKAKLDVAAAEILIRRLERVAALERAAGGGE